MTDAWAPVRDALERAGEARRTITVWLRDDDCIAVTPALDRLTASAEAIGLPLLLAVVPEPAEAALAGWIAEHPAVTPCQHGFAHRNHAPLGERAREIGGARPMGAVLDELACGRSKLRALFGSRLADILVPPWNRLDPDVVPHLATLGFTALSTFASRDAPDGRVRRLDSDLDIIDWRNGRVGRRPPDLAARLADLVGRQDVIGLLTHHLAHDAAAWDGFAAMLTLLAKHPTVRFASAEALLG